MKKYLLLLAAIVLIPTSAKAADSYQYVTQSSFATVKHGEVKQASLTLRNNGTSTWCRDCANPFRLGTESPRDRGSGFYDSATWIAPNRIGMQEATVAPGQDAHFVFNIKPLDSVSGTWREYFSPVIEGVAWLPNIGIYWDWTVPAPVGTWLYMWHVNDGHNDQRWSWTFDDPVMAPETTLFTEGHYAYGNYVAGVFTQTIDQTNLLRKQLTLIRDAGIDFVALDWWENEPAIWEANKTAAALIQSEFPTLKYTFMVDSSTNNTPIPTYFTDWVWANHANNPQFMKVNGKPYLQTFLKTPNGDTRFAVTRWQTTKQTAGYPLYWSIPVQSVWGNTSVIPRYDDYPLCNNGLRTGCEFHDPTYAQGLADQQLNQAFSFRGQTKETLMIPWNEYHERTQWEPQDSPDSNVAPDYVYQKLKTFILTRWKV